MKVDVLFIHPGGQKEIYQELSKEFTAIATPVWNCLLANFVREKGYATAVYDTNIDGWSNESAKQVLEKYNPELITIMVYGHQPSASTQTMPVAGKIAKDIKKYNPEIPIAMGGLHPSALPERTLNEEDIDFVIQGEGPYTIEGLINFLKGKINIDIVKGVWHKKDGKINFTLSTPLVKDLDTELNDYAWDLLPSLSNYRAHNMHCFQYFNESKKEDFSDVRSPYVTMNTSLGCPYSCHYCCINAVFGKPHVRYWSLEKVMSWVDIVVNKYSVRNIRFDDELFILLPKRVEKFCDMLIERNYDLNIMVYGRIDTIPDFLLKKMRKAGVRWICPGIESASELVRKDVNKIIRGNIKTVIKSIQDNDIYVLGNFMFGLPEDNFHTMQETLNLAVELNCEYVNFYTVMGYPGSKLYEWASTKDGYLPESWYGFSQHSYETKPLPTKYLSSAEVLRFRDGAFHKYFSNPVYLGMVEKKFSKKVRKHLEKMLTLNLKRKILGD